MRLTCLQFTSLLLVILCTFGCQRQVEDFQTETLSDYEPLQMGKYITYRLDSTVFTNFGRTEEVHSYQEKNVIDSPITDNLNRTGYRVFRYIRDTAGLQPWKASGSYTITLAGKSIEVVENNLRTVRLTLPIKEGTTWKGNEYLPSNPYSPQYNFNDENMVNTGDWDFSISSVNETLTLNGKTIDKVITVTSVDEATNAPITDPQSYASRTLSLDKFAKGIGLVYQELIMWEYQPNPGGPSPYKIGFGVKRTLLDHN